MNRGCCNSYSNNSISNSSVRSRFSNPSSYSSKSNCCAKKDNCNINFNSFGYMGMKLDTGPAKTITIGSNNDITVYNINTFTDFLARWEILAGPPNSLIITTPGKYKISASVTLIQPHVNPGSNYVIGITVTTNKGITLLEINGNGTDPNQSVNPSYSFYGERIVNLINDDDTDFPVSLYLNLILQDLVTITYKGNWASLTVIPV